MEDVDQDASLDHGSAEPVAREGGPQEEMHREWRPSGDVDGVSAHELEQDQE